MERQYMTLQELIDEEREEVRAEAAEELSFAILTFLASKGTVTDELRLKITREKELKVLRHWIDLAVESDSVEQFMQRIL